MRELLQEISIKEPSGRTVAVRPALKARGKFFGCHRSGAIRDGVLKRCRLQADRWASGRE